MIWGELEYTLGGLIVAIVFVVLGLMGLFKWADSGNENDKQKSSEANTANNNKEDELFQKWASFLGVTMDEFVSDGL